jgi:thymidylate synthase
MNKLDLDYQNLLKDILENGTEKTDRTGTGTISVFGRQIRHKMSEGFPLLTTKKMYFKGIVTELLWFLRGDTNIKYLVDNDCHIWDGDAYKSFEKEKKELYDYASKEAKKYSPNFEPIPLKYETKEEFINKIKTDIDFAKKWGDLGFIYGKQWRRWQFTELKKEENNVQAKIGYVDQIKNLIHDLKTNPDSRRLMVNSWNVGELDQMVLPPCHYGFQCYTRELSLDERMKLFNDSGKNGGTLMWAGNGTQEGALEHNGIPTRAISLMWNQRSVDTPLGLPFNIASYGLLLEMLAKMVNMVPDELIGNLGDTHIYSNQIDGAKEQIGRELSFDERAILASSPEMIEDKHYTNEAVNELTLLLDENKIPKRTREPYTLPRINMNKFKTDEFWKALSEDLSLLSHLDSDSFKLDNYKSHSSIKFPLSN